MPGTDPPPRYCSHLAFPPYTYVPGRFPHPISDPAGHSFGHSPPAATELEAGNWQHNETYLHALDLFNHGYYWEAHEAWESLWHASGRKGPTANFLKGLIKLAAAGVKAREEREDGIRRHARRAAELLRACPWDESGLLFGLKIKDLITRAEGIATTTESLVIPGNATPAPLAMMPVLTIPKP